MFRRVNGWGVKALFVLVLAWSEVERGLCAAGPAKDDVTAAMRKATSFFHGHVATHGGYVYHYSLDLNERWGEGAASRDQIWVQPPGTPSVGLAFLKAYEATGDRSFLQAAEDAAQALIYGQLASGGWTNCVDFNPRGDKVAQYRNGKGKGADNSTLDDGITQTALRFLMNMDRALDFKNAKIHDATMIGLESLLKAQFPNGAFPQVWKGPVLSQPIVRAQFPKYDWRTEGKIKNYWDMYTLNDDVAVYVSETLIEAHRIYRDERFKASLAKLGDFLLLAQMPEPQPAWSQQYSYDMIPIWARRFEPAGISGRESQGALETLLKVYEATKEKKYLAPFPSALAYLERSRLPDGRLARYYELQTNRPLYMQRSGKEYSLTYDDAKLPDHYGWKNEARIEPLRQAFERAQRGEPVANEKRTRAALETKVAEVLKSLDDKGRWITVHQGEGLVGQPKIEKGSSYISSAVFCRNLETLSEYLLAIR